MWDQQAVLLARSYVQAVQRAGALVAVRKAMAEHG